MTAAELYKAGQLQAAIDAQIQEVKSQPGDQGKRLFLFELLAFAGDLDRAQRQIEAVNYGQADIDAAVFGYRKLLAAERTRRLVFEQKAQPKFLIPPPEHVRTRLLGLAKLTDNLAAEAGPLFAEANGQIPALKGTINDTPFESLRDGDDRLGSVLEVMSNGEYLWVPMEQISSIVANPPKAPRDLLWIHARLEMPDGKSGEVYLPSQYPGSHLQKDDQLRLGRMTDWLGGELGPVFGVGAKTFLVGEEGSVLLDWREVQFETE